MGVVWPGPDSGLHGDRSMLEGGSWRSATCGSRWSASQTTRIDASLPPALPEIHCP